MAATRRAHFASTDGPSAADPAWSRHLEVLADEEAEVARPICPKCGRVYPIPDGLV